jgi:hypothetical protein
MGGDMKNLTAQKLYAVYHNTNEEVDLMSFKEDSGGNGKE